MTDHRVTVTLEAIVGVPEGAEPKSAETGAWDIVEEAAQESLVGHEGIETVEVYAADFDA